MNKVVTRVLQGCDNIVYNAYSGDKVMTRLFLTTEGDHKVVQHTHNLVKG